MALFARRERPPAWVRGLLEPEERVVSFADVAPRRGADVEAAHEDDAGVARGTDAGAAPEVVVATSLGLWWPGEDGPRRIPWSHIDKAVWADGRLTVTEADVLDDELLIDRRPVGVALSEPRDLPPEVRKRVEGTIVRTELLSVPGGSVRFVGRRRPGLDGVVWWARLEPGTRATDEVLASIRARLAILRESAVRG